jgi:predicted CoA-substrate-specific enzyme activase
VVYIGCDLGTVAAKLVVLQADAVATTKTLAYKNLPKQAAVAVLEQALSELGLAQDAIGSCVATGFGRKAVPYATSDVPEVLCLNRGARRLNPAIRTVIDVGGQSIRAFALGENGKVTDSTGNEKCAAGTGKFIEVMAKALELPLDQVGELSLTSQAPVNITSQCGVFAESEVITYVNDGIDRADIIAGINRSVASKISSLARRITLTEPIALVGGVAKNQGVRQFLEKELGIKLLDFDFDPQNVSALGAAVLAQERKK